MRKVVPAEGEHPDGPANKTPGRAGRHRVERGTARGLRRRTPVPALAVLVVLLLTGCSGWGDVLDSSTPGPGGGDECSTADPTSTDVGLRLPRPSGPYPVGESTFELTDRKRTDPLAPDGRPRALPVQVWYPADPHGEPNARYAPAATLALAEKHLHVCSGHLRVGLTARHAAAVRTPPTGGWPVLVYSPASASIRMLATSLVQSLASLGYVVLVVDRPFDSLVAEFPDGRVVRGPSEPIGTGERARRVFDTHVADLRFVLDRLGSIGRGNPATPVRGALDTDRVGMVGHGSGGAATVHVMLADSRVAAGANLDGDNPGPAPDADLGRPLLTFGSADGGPRNDPGWKSLWPRLRGRHRELTVRGSGHLSFTDAGILLERWDVRRTWSAEQLGRIAGRRSVQIVVTYLGAFFDQVFSGRPSGLLEQEDPTHPEVVFDR
ncbi:MAG: hypothetical protein QG608_2721 [Actinomycetota bacterium]|nr:hypothetical protein [Actinomycetota bacterium]